MKCFLVVMTAALALAGGTADARTTITVRPSMPSIRPAMPSYTAPRAPAPRVTMPPVGSTPAQRRPIAPSQPLNTYSVRNNVVLWGILFGGLTATQARTLDAAKVAANCEQGIADGKLPPGLNCDEISRDALRDVQ